MKYVILVIGSSLVAGTIGFIAAAYFPSSNVLDRYNSMASDNFQTALVLFRDGYENQRVVLFGEGGGSEIFSIGDIEFKVLPGSKTTTADSEDDFNSGLGNTAAHLNSMVVMLACKWMEEDDPNGELLLDRLKEHMPSFRVSAPAIAPVAIRDLDRSSPLVKAEASQWQWRMH